jgi:hypothetical protein
VKRPILVLLAAGLLNFGIGGAPAHAATGDSATAARPAHDSHGYRHRDRDQDHWYRDRDHRSRDRDHWSRDHDRGEWHHHDRDHDGDDDGHDGRRDHCAGLIVVCLL